MRFRVEPPVARRAKRVVIGDSESETWLSLGVLAEVGPKRDVVLDLSSEHVVAVVGKRGSGKTHALGVLAEGLVAETSAEEGVGLGERDHAVLVLDTLNLFQWVHIGIDEAGGKEAKSQRDALRKWRLSPKAIEPFYWHVAGTKPALAESKALFLRPADMLAQDWAMLIGADTMMDPMGQLVTAACDKVVRTGWGTPDEHESPQPDYMISALISCIQVDQDLTKEFAPETRRAVTQRLAAFDRSGLFSKSGTSVAELLVPGRMTVLLLRGVPDDIRTAVSFLLIRKILEERSAASEAAKHAVLTRTGSADGHIPKTWLLIDEAQNLLPSRGMSLANEVLTRFVREGRNFGLSMAISTQQPTAIDTRVMAQVDVLMAHTLTVKQDVSYITGNLKAVDPRSVHAGSKKTTLGDSLRLLEVGHCLTSATDSERSFYLEVRPRVSLHGGFEA